MSGRITRAVVYRRRRDGTFDIRFAEPWKGERRLDAFPPNIQQMVQERHAFEATTEQLVKLKSAERISPGMYQAVWDDIMCEKAVRMLEQQGRSVVCPPRLREVYRFDRDDRSQEQERTL